MWAQTEPDLDACREILRKILESEIFSGSRQLSQFLIYCANASLEGRSTLDQYEIAREVLGRSAEFNPWDDATVRKLATRLRQKLEDYYAGPGNGDAILLALPKRSYLPRFRLRDDKVQHDDSELDLRVPESPVAGPDSTFKPQSIPVDSPKFETAITPVVRPTKRITSKWYGIAAGLAIVALVSAVAILYHKFRTTRPDLLLEENNTITIHTARGDLRGPLLDVAPDAVRIGPAIGDGEEAMTRLCFAPQYPTQQAGLMAMFDPDHFVRLGDHFKNYTLTELGIEHDGLYQNSLTTYAFDMLAQKGICRWLAIRRTGQTYKGFISSDGFYWRAFGPGLGLPGQTNNPRAAIYAFNGRTDSPSQGAMFSQFGTSLAFHSRTDEPFNVSRFPNWTQETQCGSPVTADINQEALQIGFTREAIGCKWRLTRSVDEGDWSFSTLVDFEPVLGSSVSLFLKGTKQKIAFSRRDLGGGSLVLERADDQDSRISDFPGSPPVILRFEKRGNNIRASASLDGERFYQVGEQIRTEELGTLKRIGIGADTANWATPVGRPPARVFWISEETLNSGTLRPGNVPAQKGT